MAKALAYSYIRMSTHIQLKGDSLRRQREASADYALANDLELVRDFKLEDIGLSAFNGKHVAEGNLGLFIRKIQDGEVPTGSYLLVESLDRLSRQVIQRAASQFFQILEAGINIVTLSDQHVYLAGKTDLGDIIYSIVIMSRANEESETKSLRVGQAWQNKRRNLDTKKLTKVAPLWLRLRADRTAFDVIENKASVIQQIFDEADAGKGSYQISRAFNLAAVPTIGPSNGWHESYISKILTNRAVIGEFQPHHYNAGKREPTGEPIPDYFPAVIEKEQFYRVQYGRKQRRIRGAGRKGDRHVNLFSGLAKCGYCNASILVIDKGDKPKGGVYLRCDSARRGNDCQASSWPIEHFEYAFLSFVSEVDLASLLGAGDASTKRKQLDDQILLKQSEIDGQKQFRDRAFELLQTPNVDVPYVSARLSAINLEIAALEKAVGTLSDESARLMAAKPIGNGEKDVWISSVQGTDKAAIENRTKVSNWMRMNIREVQLYPDGLESDKGGPTKGNQVSDRQFSVLFESGVFRTISFDSDVRGSFKVSIRADDDGYSVKDAESGVEEYFRDVQAE